MPTVPTHVALLGGINMDVSVHAHSALRNGDSNAGRVQCSPGGVARNVAENLLRLGLDARLLGVLGDDVFGQALWQSGAAMGLDMRACLTLRARIIQRIRSSGRSARDMLCSSVQSLSDEKEN